MTVLHCTRKLAAKLSGVSAAPIDEQSALEGFLKTKPAGRLFDLHESGPSIERTIRESR